MTDLTGVRTAELRIAFHPNVLMPGLIKDLTAAMKNEAVVEIHGSRWVVVDCDVDAPPRCNRTYTFSLKPAP